MKLLPPKQASSLVACIVVLCLLARPDAAMSLELGKYFKRNDQYAIELLEDGQHEQAATAFDDPRWRGVSQYRSGKYSEAMQEFNGLEDANGLYNHGTAAARAGDYTQAVTSLESALKLAPDNKEIAHNLAVAKKLKQLAEEQQQQDSQENNSEKQDSEEQDKDEQDEKEQESDSEGDNSESQQPQGEEGSESGDNGDDQTTDQSSQEQSDGDMSTESNDQPSDEQQQDAEELRDMMQQEQERNSEDQAEQDPQAVPAPQNSVSEDDQATQQWLRRIPDDASQLLRNKIRLNHLIEYPEVDDMQEPW